jgi:hypothetical protein
MTTSYREVPGTFATLITLSSILSYLRRKPGPADSIDLDEQCVPMNTFRMLITPKAIQDLLDELEASKQSRLRAWKALQRLRSIFSELGTLRFRCRLRRHSSGKRDPGACSDQMLPDSERGDEKLMLLSSALPGATIKEECKSDYPRALQALWKALDRAENLIRIEAMSTRTASVSRPGTARTV